MSDYMWAKTENIHKFLNKQIKEAEERLISEFLKKLEHMTPTAERDMLIVEYEKRIKDG